MTVMIWIRVLPKHNVVRFWHKIDSDFALSPNNFSAHIMTMSLRAGAIEIRDLATPELDHTNRIVDITRIGKFWMVLQSACCPADLRNWVVEIPQGEVDVVDCLEKVRGCLPMLCPKATYAVNKYSPIASGVPNKKASRV